MEFVTLEDILSEGIGENDCEPSLYQVLCQSEEQAVQVLESLKLPLSLRDGARCLQKALQDGSVELFRKILEHCEAGESTGQYLMPRETPGWGMQCHGSLVTLAAMMDRPRQTVLLLERGYDVNGSGLNVADYLRQDGKLWGDEAPLPYARFCGSAGCQIVLQRECGSPVGICCVTPLAAALLCGSLQTAEVLLRWQGVWRGESSAVCRAAVMVLEGLAGPALSEERRRNQLEILRQIFCPEQPVLTDRKSFLRSVYLQPASFVDFCRTDTLRYQLESGLCTEEDARRMLEVLSVDMWWKTSGYDRSRAEKLLLLKKHFPELCREGWVTGIFLRELLRRIRGNIPHQRLLKAWKESCGQERDLTWIGDVWSMNWRELNGFLKEVGEGGTLVMDADALSQWYGVSFRGMLTLLKRVRFRYRDGAGVNGMMQQLLASGDLRLLRQAAKQGLFAQEDPKLLLEHLAEAGLASQDVRAVVLTYARNRPDIRREKADWREPRRWPHWCSWERREEETAQRHLRRLLRQELPREACLKTMFHIHQHLNQGLFSPDMVVEHQSYPQLKTDSLVGIACCAEYSQPLELLLEHLPEQLLKPLRASWGEKFFFRGTPLTFAAALGRTEQVRLLLESGNHPDEAGRGDVSRFFVRASNFVELGVPVTPVLAAILFGQEGTARLLLEHGASCDFSRPEHLRVLLQGSAKTLELAGKLPNVGFEKIPAETLEAMRIMTADRGERTQFWRSLQR